MPADSPLATLERAAKALFEAGRYAEAAMSFERAFRMSNDPAFLYNMAVCYRLLGDSARAVVLYEDYLVRVPQSPQRPAVEARIRQLRQEQAAAQAGGGREAPVAPAYTPAPNPVPTAPPPGAGMFAAPPPPLAPAVGIGPALTEAQLSELRSAGASLDAQDMEIADRLMRRGFTGDDVVAAYREHSSLKLTYPELARFGRETVETIAVARRLGLDENDKYWLVWYRHDRNMRLTDAYNERVLGGPGFKAAGWVLTASGAAALIAGLVLYLDGVQQNDSCNADRYCSGSNPGDTNLVIGSYIMAPAGAILAGIGIPLLVSGYRRTGQWLPPGTLESSANQIGSPRASAPTALRWAAAPSIGPNHVGFGLRAAF